MNPFRFIARVAVCLVILLAGWGVFLPHMVAAANFYVVAMGFLLIPVVPLAIWFTWKLAFRKKVVAE